MTLYPRLGHCDLRYIGNHRMKQILGKPPEDAPTPLGGPWQQAGKRIAAWLRRVADRLDQWNTRKHGVPLT